MELHTHTHSDTATPRRGHSSHAYTVNLALIGSGGGRSVADLDEGSMGNGNVGLFD